MSLLAYSNACLSSFFVLSATLFLTFFWNFLVFGKYSIEYTFVESKHWYNSLIEHYHVSPYSYQAESQSTSIGRVYVFNYVGYVLPFQFCWYLLYYIESKVWFTSVAKSLVFNAYFTVYTYVSKASQTCMHDGQTGNSI